jgi:hypothetical protein
MASLTKRCRGRSSRSTLPGKRALWDSTPPREPWKRSFTQLRSCACGPSPKYPPRARGRRREAEAARAGSYESRGEATVAWPRCGEAPQAARCEGMATHVAGEAPGAAASTRGGARKRMPIRAGKRNRGARPTRGRWDKARPICVCGSALIFWTFHRW